MSWAKRGAQCICIKGEPWLTADGSQGGDGPRVNEICTIEQIINHPHRGVGLVLREFDADDHIPVFPIQFFVPLKPMLVGKTDDIPRVDGETP